MFRGNLNRVGITNDTDSANSASVLWTYTTRDSVWSSPAVANESIFVGSKDSHIYRLNSTNGELIWKFGPVGGEVDSSPAVDGDQVYVSADDGFLYCLNISSGYPCWIKWLGFYSRSSPAVSAGRLYIGSGTKNLLCFNTTDGSVIWNCPTQFRVVSSPAVENGIVYFASDDYSVHAVNASTGNEIWRHLTGSTISSPSVCNGTVYIGSYQGYIYDLDASTGAQNWVYQTQDEVDSSPAVAYGRVYVGSEDNHLYCLNASTGQKLWASPTGYWVWSSPAVEGGYVYVGSEDYNVYCFNAVTGEKVWSYATGSYVDSSPAIANNTLFVGSHDDNVYAFRLYNSTVKLTAASSPVAWTTIAFDAAAIASGAAIVFAIARYFRPSIEYKRHLKLEGTFRNPISWFSIHPILICLLSVLAFSSVFFIAISTNNLGSSFLWAADEQTYSQLAVHMIKSQDYLTPWSFGALSLWTGKPPLNMWLMTLSYQAFGISNFSSRIWAAVSGCLSLVVVFFLGKKLYNTYVGFLSAIILGSFTTFFAFATHAMLDVPLVFFMLSSIYFLVLSEKPERTNLYSALSGLFFGLALMTKQIAALLIPLIVIVYFVIINRSVRSLFTKRFGLFLGVGFLVVAPWLIYMNMMFGGQFWQCYFVYSDLTRALNSIEGHGHSFLYYFNYLATRENLIWVILLPFSVAFCALNLLFKRSRNDALILIWISIVLAVFTFAQTKIYYYILPAYPAFAIAIGSFVFELYKRMQLRFGMNRKWKF